mmetsp:Transcript_31855/g.55432  ORF Transcript_31855/g.55432 Transcript_31855/m.55432 type:complete len:201 (-) Transcript_31855:861-1463(-)
MALYSAWSCYCCYCSSSSCCDAEFCKNQLHQRLGRLVLSLQDCRHLDLHLQNNHRHLDLHLQHKCRHLDLHVQNICRRLDLCRHLDLHLQNKCRNLDLHLQNSCRHLDLHLQDNCRTLDLHRHSPYQYPHQDLFHRVYTCWDHELVVSVFAVVIVALLHRVYTWWDHELASVFAAIGRNDTEPTHPLVGEDRNLRQQKGR